MFSSLTVCMTICTFSFISLNQKNLLVHGYNKSPIQTHNNINLLKPIKEFIDYIATSFSKAFSPLDYDSKKSSPLRLYLPTQTKSNRMKGLRKEHKRNVWNEEDISDVFEQHYILQDESLLTIKRMIPTNNTMTKELFSYTTKKLLPSVVNDYDNLYNNINDPTSYVSDGIPQTIHPLQTNNETAKNEDSFPPLG